MAGRSRGLLIGSVRYWRGRRCFVRSISPHKVGVTFDGGERLRVFARDLRRRSNDGACQLRLTLRDRVRMEFLEIRGREPTGDELAAIAGDEPFGG